MSNLLYNKFNETKFETVTNTVNYPISKIPFPAITICHNKRLSYVKIQSAAAKFYPESLNSTLKFENFKTIATILNVVNYRRSQIVYALNNLTGWEELSNINLKQLYEFMVIKCEDFIVKCWLQNAYVSCCDIFKPQWTAFGLCYSFNSALSLSAPGSNVSL